MDKRILCGVRDFTLSSFAVLAVSAVVNMSLILSAGVAEAQVPKINTLYPIGGKAGTTVEVEVRGSNLAGADKLIVSGQGVTGSVQPGGAKVDDKFKPLFQSKCASCHELRSPANRSMTAGQWAATVDRMVKVRNAPLSATEAANVTQYLQGMARAGRITAQVQISPDASPGIVEVRVGTNKGVSTACLFEVGNLPEVMGQAGTLESAQTVKLPVVANGTLAGNAERHFYKFTAQKSQRIIFNLKGFRFDERTQLFFNPNLRLYDSKGTEIGEDHGHYDLDPLLDWVCPADGDYTVEVRDLLGRGNPGSVYRLTMGSFAYDTTLYPPAIQVRSKADLSLRGKNIPEGMRYSVSAPAKVGMEQVDTPGGSQMVYVSRSPVVTTESISGAPVKLPAAICGRIPDSGREQDIQLAGTGESYDFEVIGPRLGSPISPVAVILDAKGRPVARIRGENKATAKLESGQNYTLRVQNIDGRGGSEYVYIVEARPVQPVVDCVVRPDAITVKPGMVTPVEVQITRRDGVDGDIQIAAQGLPAGVTAESVYVQPDRQSAWVLLTASADAKPGEIPIRFVASAKGPNGEASSQAVPQEMYLMNNNPRYMNRVECLLAVRGEADFTAEIVGSVPLKVHPTKAVPVKVRIKRREGFAGPVTIRMEGLPTGWTASPESIPANKTEATLNVRPDGNNKTGFLNRSAALKPIITVIEAIVDDYPFVAGTLVVQKPDKITDEKDER